MKYQINNIRNYPSRNRMVFSSFLFFFSCFFPVLAAAQSENTFTNVTDSASVGDSKRGMGAAWADYDNDGDLDLHVLNGGISSPQLSKLYQNNGDGTFINVAGDAGIQTRGFAEGASWGDYDNDGDMDLYVVNYGEANILYQNNGNKNNWLIVNAVGSKSNRSAIGARIKIIVDNMVQIREIDGGSGFCSQDSLRAHFGLNTYETIDTLEIRWPDGNTQILNDVQANQILTFTEQ